MSKLTNAALLVRDDVVTIQAVYEQTDNNRGSSQSYTFVCDKALAATLAVGDTAVGFGKGKLAIVNVVKVDAECLVDIDAPYDYQWIAAKVDLNRVASNQWKTEAIAEKLAVRQRENTRRQALAQLNLTDEEVKQLQQGI